MNPVPLFLIIVTLPLLLGGCGEKTTFEPVAEVKPELEGVNRDELEFREDIVYLKGSDTPYTGKYFRLYKNGQKLGQKLQEGNFKDGKWDGLETWWYENGQKESEVTYKDGKLDGLTTGWYENGEKKAEKNYKNGKWDGLAVQWYKNGQKRFEGNYKDGNIVDGSLKYWNRKGEPVDSFEEAEAE